MKEFFLNIYTQLTAVEIGLGVGLLVLVGLIIYLVREMKRLSIYNQKKAEESVLGEWASTREDKSAYLLSVYNNTSERIYNIEVHTQTDYQMCSKVFWKKNKAESQQTVNIFFIPGGWTEGGDVNQRINRETFIENWIGNRLKPIVFTVSYTESPSRANPITFTVPFKKEQLTGHLKRALKTRIAKPVLKSIPPPST